MSHSTRRTGGVVLLCLAVVVAGLPGLAVAQTGESPTESAGPSISVGAAPDDDSAPLAGQPGTSVTVTVWANASDVRGYQTSLSFDPDVVQVVSVSAGDEFAEPVSRVDNDGGVVAFNQLRGTGVDNPVLARITFELTGQPGTETTLSFAEASTGLADSNAAEIGLVEYNSATISVEEPAEPTLTVSPSSPDIGTEMQFGLSNSGPNVDSYEWSFGDGTSASGQQVSHAYLEPGTYTVSVRTEDASGDQLDEYTREVTVERAFADVTQIEPGEQVRVPDVGDPYSQEVDVYGIDVEAGQAIATTAVGINSDLLLYSPNGEQLDRLELNIDRGPAGALMGTTAEESGTYYVVVSRSLTQTAFTVRLLDPDPFEPNQERSTATAIESESPVEGTVTEADREDWFVVEAGEGELNATAELTLPANFQNNIAVDIYNENGESVGELGADDEESSPLDLPPNRTFADDFFSKYWAEQRTDVETTGTYYVRVRWLDDDAYSDGPAPYELTVNAAEPAGQLDPLCEGCDPPQDLDGDGTYEDVNGNDIQGFGDVVTLFNNLQADTVTQNAELYDYNDNGVVGFGDVIWLFERI